MSTELQNELSFFAVNQRAAELLGKILEQVSEFERESDGSFLISFKASEDQWTVLGRPTHLPPGLPADLKKILTSTGGSWFGEPGTSTGIELHDGISGTLHTLGNDAGLDPQRDGLSYSPNLYAPLDVGLGRFYLYHPATGALQPFDPDGGLQTAVDRTVTEVFLALVLDAIQE